MPNNDGCFKPVTIRAPEGTIVNCSYPAPVASRAVSLFRVEDVVLGVMAQAVPERMIGANSGQYTMVSVSGFYPGTTEPMIGQLGGPGTFRGGLGFYAEVEWTAGDCNIMLRRERTRFQPWGIMGGYAAPVSRAEHQAADGAVRGLPAKTIFPLKAGERLRYWTTGSGGYGSPLERNSSSVLEDLRNGRITADAARSEYGVVITGDQVDQKATSSLRESMRAEAT